MGALHVRAADAPAIERYLEVGRILTGRADATIADGIRWVHALCTDLAIPGLAQYGMTADDIPAVVVEAQHASSTKGNPIALTDEELASVLQHAL
jgi:alcohol dehydrogenase class IV